MDGVEQEYPQEDPRRQESTVIRGRGAVTNRASRFLPTVSVAVDDGWVADEAPPSNPLTTLTPDRTVRLITRNRSPDIPFDRSINPYKGCEHGCIYCFARPTHAYLDLSPGLDFETRIFFKTNVRRRLHEELSARRYECRPIAMGTNTDPYQPAERKRRITREILEMLLEWRHPVTIVTKSALVLRDLDLLGEMARLDLVHVNVSMTTLDRVLKTRLEPRTASPGARLKTIEALAGAGVPVGAMIAPVIPFVNDAEIETLVEASAAAGAGAMGYILLRLPAEVGPLFQEWLAEHYPLKAARVENAVRQMRGGKLYQAGWGARMRGAGPMAELIEKRFARALTANGIDRDARLVELRTDLFRPPGCQASLF
ncbi:MAG: PA0069 family radical SAM protein [Pseudomonadales bacterium]